MFGPRLYGITNTTAYEYGQCSTVVELRKAVDRGRFVEQWIALFTSFALMPATSRIEVAIL